MAVTVSVTVPPGDTLVPPEICTVGTAPFAMVVCAELGEPTEYPVPEATDITMVVFGWTVVVARVCTVTDACSAPAGRVTEVGGVITFSDPAVPLGVRSTVMAEVDAVDALTTKSAGWPAVTWSATDAMVRVGIGSSASSAIGWAAPRVDRVTEAACVVGGPMISPAVFWSPSA